MVDTEYQGSDGVIRVDRDELVFVKGGRLTRAVAGEVPWRIPIDCIREVVFDDSRFKPGFLHLVIGDAARPKGSLWSVTGISWTITLNDKNQKRRFAELTSWLNGRIQLNTAHGIDPLTARRPYVDPAASVELDAMKQRLLGHSLVRQPTPTATPSDVIELARRTPSYSQSWTDLDSLTARLARDEPIRLLALGMLGPSTVLVVLTDRRIIIHSDNPTSRKSEDLPTAGIQVVWASALVLGGLTFTVGSRHIKVSAFDDETSWAFIDGAAEQAAPAAGPTQDVLAQLRRLGALRDTGVLTAEEFIAKKAELLRRL